MGLRAAGVDAVLVVAGDGPLHGRLVELAAGQPVRFTRFLADRTDVAALLGIGSNNSFIGILMNGELALTRTVNVGAGKLADFFGKTGAIDRCDCTALFNSVGFLLR